MTKKDKDKLRDQEVMTEDKTTQIEEKPLKKAASKLKKLSKTAKLQAQIDEMDIQLKEEKDKFLRLYAEFDNYKKRTLKEKIDYMKTASSEAIKAMLPVLDDFDRAKKSADDDKSEEHFTDGVIMIYNKIYNTLDGLGLEPMESTGEIFDPELHEAITEIPAPSDDMKGKVIDTIEKGYLLKDKIIRHAKVVVGK